MWETDNVIQETITSTYYCWSCFYKLLEFSHTASVFCLSFSLTNNDTVLLFIWGWIHWVLTPAEMVFNYVLMQKTWELREVCFSYDWSAQTKQPTHTLFETNKLTNQRRVWKHGWDQNVSVNENINRGPSGPSECVSVFVFFFPSPVQHHGGRIVIWTPFYAKHICFVKRSFINVKLPLMPISCPFIYFCLQYITCNCAKPDQGTRKEEETEQK